MHVNIVYMQMRAKLEKLLQFNNFASTPGVFMNKSTKRCFFVFSKIVHGVNKTTINIFSSKSNIINMICSFNYII